jgi:RNA-binding protein
MLTGAEKKYLRGLAHSLKPIVVVGQKGLTDALALALDQAFADHELVKVRFLEFKEKEQKRELIGMIETKNACACCGMIGHIAIFYRQNPDVEKRKIDFSRFVTTGSRPE